MVLDSLTCQILLFYRYCVTFTKANACTSRKTYTAIYIVFKCTANYLFVSPFFLLTPIRYICIANILQL